MLLMLITLVLLLLLILVLLLRLLLLLLVVVHLLLLQIVRLIMDVWLSVHSDAATPATVTSPCKDVPSSVILRWCTPKSSHVGMILTSPLYYMSLPLTLCHYSVTIILHVIACDIVLLLSYHYVMCCCL